MTTTKTKVQWNGLINVPEGTCGEYAVKHFTKPAGEKFRAANERCPRKFGKQRSSPMAIEILGDHNQACMICTTTDWAFGPVFIGNDASDRATWFLKWHCGKYGDPRTCDDSVLESHYSEWLAAYDAAKSRKCYWCDAPIYDGEKLVAVVDGEPHTPMHESCAAKRGEEYAEKDVQVAGKKEKAAT